MTRIAAFVGGTPAITLGPVEGRAFGAVSLRYLPDVGWWVGTLELLLGERIVWACGAARQQGSLRQIGGRLFATNHRLILVPNRLASLTGRGYWSLRLSDVADLAPELGRVTGQGSSFSVRRRLQITDRSGQIEMFVVNGLERVCEYLRSVVPAGEL